MAAQNNAPEQESAVKTMVVPVIVLVAICLVCSALLAVLNSVTAPIIEENERLQTLESYVAVLPEGTGAESLQDVEGLTTAGVQGAVTTPDGYTVVKAAAAGYSGKDVTVYVCFGQDGTINTLSVDASTQTTGIGSKVQEDSFTSGFAGWNGGTVSSGSPVDTVAGATYSSNAVFSAVNAAIDCYTNEIKGVA